MEAGGGEIQKWAGTFLTAPPPSSFRNKLRKADLAGSWRVKSFRVLEPNPRKAGLGSFFGRVTRLLQLSGAKKWGNLRGLFVAKNRPQGVRARPRITKKEEKGEKEKRGIKRTRRWGDEGGSKGNEGPFDVETLGVTVGKRQDGRGS